MTLQMLNNIKLILEKLSFKAVALYILKKYSNVFPNHIISRNGLKYAVDLRQVVDFGTFLGGWEKETVIFLKKTLKRGDVVIEVGSNVGAHTLLMARLVGEEGHVYAFEPTSFASTKLHRNISLNPELTNITVSTEIVTNNSDSLPTLYLNSSWTTAGVQAPMTIENPVSTSIDKVVSKSNIKKLDMIKIDVDGYDFKVLQGATAAIEALQPVIYMELCEYALQSQNDSIKDIFSLTEGLGYEAYYANGVKAKRMNEILDEVGLNASINCIFFPESRMHNICKNAQE